MFEQFTQEARTTVHRAVSESERRGDRHIGTEHLLLGLTGSATGHVRSVLDAAGADLVAAREALTRADREALAAVGVEVAPLPPVVSDDARPRRGFLRRHHRPFTDGAKRSLERALRVALGRGDRHIGTEHLLLALAATAAPDPAHQLLRGLSVDPAALHADLERRLDRAA